jgi:hypothetical protein
VALPQLQVIERLEVELGPLPDLPQGDVVLLGLPIRRVRVRQVGERDEDLLTALVELVELGLELLELGLQRARALAELRELGLIDLAGLGRLLDLRGELVLVGPDRVDPGVELAPALIDAKQLVDLLGRVASREG